MTLMDVNGRVTQIDHLLKTTNRNLKSQSARGNPCRRAGQRRHAVAPNYCSGFKAALHGAERRSPSSR